MSTKGKRNFRPVLHFSPKTGWVNDPNGLVYADGIYHLFAQHYPDDTVWGPMHWYHVTSTDLIHWEHQPIALYPDDLGWIFSGSAVLDKENTSGFGVDGKAPIVAMYTSHKHTDNFKDYEQQSIAYSVDGGKTFIKYEGNPVIASDLRDFRDPKVFKNPVTGKWSVVMAQGDRVVFYTSADLKVWEKTGEFGPEGNHADGVWECPDIFPLTVNGEEKWVLMVSMGPSPMSLGARVQYFLGTFDGNTFICDMPFEDVEYIDTGLDNYAAVTYDNTDERILVGWGTNGAYANATPTGEFCCIHTVPRVMTLVDTPKGGIRLAGKPVSDKFFCEGAPYAGTLPADVFKLTVGGEGAAAVTLKNKEGQTLTFGVDKDNKVFFDRTKAGAKDFNLSFASKVFGFMAADRFYDGAWTIELTMDVSACEMFIDNGTRAFSNVLFPDSPYTELTVDGAASVTVHGYKG